MAHSVRGAIFIALSFLVIAISCVATAGSTEAEPEAGKQQHEQLFRLTEEGAAPFPIAPLAPVWPPYFTADFTEEFYIGFFTLTSKGKYVYDAERQRSRIDRENGVGDRYCGSAYPFRNTPCTHLVRDGMRYLMFPEYKYCCKCCSDANGCGPIKRDWLSNATYIGQDVIYGIQSNKWNKAGLQNNYYWHTLDDKPLRIYMEFTNQMTFDTSSYDKSTPVDDALFDFPSDMDCSVGCYGICAVASGASSSLGRKSAKAEAQGIMSV